MNIDNKIYWVDRFDHILKEEEFDKIDFIGFDDVEGNYEIGNSDFFESYLKIEQNLIDFLTEITLSIVPEINNVQYKIYKNGNLDFYLNKGLDTWKLESLVQMRSSEFVDSCYFKNLDEFKFYIELALREKVNLRVLVKETIYTFGFDLKILFQCIEKDKLEKFSSKYGLSILDEFYKTFWTE